MQSLRSSANHPYICKRRGEHSGKAGRITPESKKNCKDTIFTIIAQKDCASHIYLCASNPRETGNATSPEVLEY